MWIRVWQLPTVSLLTKLPFSVAPEIRCRRSNVRCVSTEPTGQHSIWFFFGGFAELLIGRTDASIVLLRKSLERNSSYGSARMFLIAALSLSGQYREAAEAAALFRQQYPGGPAEGASSYGYYVRDQQPIAPRSFRYSTRSGVSGWEPDRRAHPSKQRRRSAGRQPATHLCILTAATTTSRPATALLRAAHSPQLAVFPLRTI